MKCEDLETGTRWVDAALGELPEEMAREAEHHLESCAGCRARLVETQQDLQLLGDLPVGPEVAEEIFVALRPVEGWPRLPEALERKLLAIPGTEPVPRPAASPIAASPANRPDSEAKPTPDLGSAVKWPGTRRWFPPIRWLRDIPEWMRARPWAVGIDVPEWLRARPWVVGTALAVALLIAVIPMWDGDTWKGQHDETKEQVSRSALRLELMIRDQAGEITRAELKPLSGGGLGAAVSRDSWLLPVLMTRTLDLSRNPWHVTVVWLEAEGRVRFLAHAPRARQLAHLPETRSSFSTGEPLRLGEVRSGTVGRLFVLVTTTHLEPTLVQKAASALTGPLAQTVSILTEEPLSGMIGYEGTMMVEVR